MVTGGDDGRDPFNQHSNRSDREKWSTSKGGPVFSKLFRLDRTDPLSFGPKFPEILVAWIAPDISIGVITLGTRNVVFNVCLHSRSFPLRSDWRKSNSSVDGEPQQNCRWNSNSRDVVPSSPSFSRQAAIALRGDRSQAKGTVQPPK